MFTVTASEFAKDIDLYKNESERGLVAILSHGRISGYFVSVGEHDELRRLREFERRVYRTKGLPKDLAEAIKAARMNPAHDHLDALLDDE